MVSEETLYAVEQDARGEYLQGEVIFIGTTRDLAEALDAGFNVGQPSFENLARDAARINAPPAHQFENNRQALVEIRTFQGLW